MCSRTVLSVSNMMFGMVQALQSVGVVIVIGPRLNKILKSRTTVVQLAIAHKHFAQRMSIRANRALRTHI
jgi:hypothetical protein